MTDNNPTILPPTAVASSNLKAIEYDGADLFVTFHSGARWCYEGVPETVVNDLLNAESIGRFFLTGIKDSYPSRAAPVEGPAAERDFTRAVMLALEAGIERDDALLVVNRVYDCG